MEWIGPAFQSKTRVLEVAMINGEVRFQAGSIYEERMVLIEALENWLAGEAMCDDNIKSA